MARPLWTGSLSFGLVNVPVSLITAVRDLDLHFHQVHERDGAPIEVKRWCSKEDIEVPYEEITHGYELEDGGQVIISDLELAAIEPRKTRTIDIEQFVDLEDVDPIYFDHPYFLVPASSDDGATRAYRLLSEVMSRTERAALGRFVMRAREYLAIVRAREGALALTTMLFPDEIRPAKDVEAAAQKSHGPKPKELDAAVAVIEELTCEFDPEKFKDEYRARLKRIVARKRKGETFAAPEKREEPSPPPDLMDALERTLAEIKRGGSGRWSEMAGRAQEKAK
ncbi:MAG TPA: Ku protein [Solirubrobacteraceae bacterium]|nr:Ku protein [Solirubrobacteraceae bacterium]